jgi:hypothetical protein
MTSRPRSPLRLWIDADGCPVLAEARRIAARHGAPVTVVAGPSARHGQESSEGYEVVVVGTASEAADDYIASHATPGEIVLTDDLLLADRCLKAGAAVLSSRGVVFTPDSIGALLARREIGKFLREVGETSGGPRPYDSGFRSRLKHALHELMERVKRAAHSGA